MTIVMALIIHMSDQSDQPVWLTRRPADCLQCTALAKPVAGPARATIAFTSAGGRAWFRIGGTSRYLCLGELDQAPKKYL